MTWTKKTKLLRQKRQTDNDQTTKCPKIKTDKYKINKNITRKQIIQCVPRYN